MAVNDYPRAMRLLGMGVRVQRQGWGWDYLELRDGKAYMIPHAQGAKPTQWEASHEDIMAKDWDVFI